MNKEEFKEIIEGFDSFLERKNIEIFKNLIDTEMYAEIEYGDDFFMQFIYPYTKLIKGIAKVKGWNDDFSFFIMNHYTIENHFERNIQQFEGSACCADKSRTIMRSLGQFLRFGTEITFDYTQEYSYHLPQKVFTTHKSIVNFFKAIQRMYYGYSDLYLVEMKKLIENNSGNE